MDHTELSEIFHIPPGKSTLEKFGTGHIHSTFRVKHEEGSVYILQKINTYVFRDPARLMDNLVRVCNYLRERTEEFRLGWQVMQYFPSVSGNFFWIDENGEYWRLFNYIDHVDLKESSLNVYRNAGEAYGSFIRILSDLPGPPLYETIPHFHDLGFRMEEHDSAIKNGNPDRLLKVKNELEFLERNRRENIELSEWIASGKIPSRITHNDPKVSNILFGPLQEVISIIDLDTVMNWTVHSDFGDALRTFGSSVAEDERDTDRVHFRMDIFEEFARGFLSILKNTLTPIELETLALAPSYFAYMQAVRFLNDFLLNDTYYHTEYEDHNLVRARNQLSLYKSMKNNQGAMMRTIDSL